MKPRVDRTIGELMHRFLLLCAVFVVGCDDGNKERNDLSVPDLTASTTPDLATPPDAFANRWTTRPSGSKANFTGVAASGDRLVVVGTSPAGTGAPVIVTSTDAASWTAATVPAGVASLASVAYASEGPLEFVAVGASPSGTPTGKIVTSQDGMNWTAQNAPATDGGLYGIAQLDATLVALGENAVLTSSDGLMWTARNPMLPDGDAPTFVAAARGGTTDVAVGVDSDENGVWASAPDVTNDGAWTQTMKVGAGLDAIAYSPTFQRFLAVGGSEVATSADGTAITVQGLNLDVQLTGVVECGGTWLAVGSSGADFTLKGIVLSSTASTPTSATDWTLEGEVDGESLRAVSCGIAAPIAVGDGGTIITR